MPRQIISGSAVKQLAASFYPLTPVTPGALTLVFTAGGDQTDRNVVLANGKTCVLAYNSDDSAHTITITSQPDSVNRLGTITDYSLDPGEIALLGPFLTAGWSNAGKLDIDVDDPLLKTTILNLP
jgi:hypothetical protein